MKAIKSFAKAVLFIFAMALAYSMLSSLLSAILSPSGKDQTRYVEPVSNRNGKAMR